MTIPEVFAQPIRVLVVDDQQIIREGLAAILGYQDGLTVVGKAVNGQEALQLAAELEPDVILMDVRMPLMDGIEATRLLHGQYPRCRILMLTTFDDQDYVLDTLRAGANGYLLKDIPAEQLAQAIRSVFAGNYQLDPAVAAKLIIDKADQSVSLTTSPVSSTSGTSSTLTRTGSDLTEREIEILQLLAQGATNREIAQQLSVAEGTVKNHVSNILARLGLRHRTDAALYARDNGLL